MPYCFSAHVMQTDTAQVDPNQQANMQASMQHVIWLLGALGLTFILHAINLTNWVSASFVVFAVWRYLIQKNNWPFPKLWLRMPLTIAGGVAVLLSYGSFFGRDASLALFLVMISLKLLEEFRKSRHLIGAV